MAAQGQDPVHLIFSINRLKNSNLTRQLNPFIRVYRKHEDGSTEYIDQTVSLKFIYKFKSWVNSL